MVTAVDPALQRCLNELHGDRLVRGALQPRAGREQAVFKHAGTCVLHLDDVQFGERVELAGLRVLGLKHLGEFVVGHRRGRVDLALEQQVHVERLLHDRHARVLGRVHACLREGCEELVLVAAEPVGDLLTLHLRDRVDPGALPRELGHARAGEDLRHVDEVGALVASCKQARKPVDTELRLAGCNDLLRNDVRATVLQRDVEARVLIEALE